jgi:hypothetical protein
MIIGLYDMILFVVLSFVALEGVLSWRLRT